MSARRLDFQRRNHLAYRLIQWSPELFEFRAAKPFKGSATGSGFSLGSVSQIKQPTAVTTLGVVGHVS